MKKLWLLSITATVLLFTACTKSQFEDAYADPAKVSQTTVEKQYAGFMASNLDYTMHKYWNYFVVLQNTALPWSQTVAMVNTPGRYVPGASAIDSRWSAYYAFLAQYKELLNLYNKLPAEEQTNKRIFIITATIFFYDQSEKMVDLFGSIPWSEAGLLGTNGGDYKASSATYDDAASIYTTMLDGLKGFADELNSIQVPAGVGTVLSTQDFINHGDMTTWKKYCNSLRVRMLMRVSLAGDFQSRSTTEMAAITGDPAAYPLVLDNADNILIDVTDPSTRVSNGANTGDAADFYQGLIGWGFNDRAGKVMIDHMNSSADPRLRVLFEPGETAPANTYIGLDPSLNSTAGTALLNAGTIARYNRSTISQNIMMPGILVEAAEINFYLAEYYLRAGSDANAKMAYEEGIQQSVDFMYWLHSISNSTLTGPVVAPTAGEITTYINSAMVSWTAAGTTEAKLQRIATEKWINYNVLQPIEAWSEVRRLNMPSLNFVSDNSGIQSLPPNRFVLPANELTYNTVNYQAVASGDQLTTKLFWDVD